MAIVVSSAYNKFERENRPRSHTLQVGEYQSIFKYVSLDSPRSWNYLRSTILDNKLIGSTNRQLNDPFELSPCQIDDLDERTIEKCHQIFDEGGSILTVPQSKGVGYKDLIHYRNRAKKIIAATIENSRIISFCNKVDSPLLWAHYANSHKGACLHFVGRAFNAEKSRKGFVCYSRQRPSLPLSLPLRLRLGLDNKMHHTELQKLETEIDRSFFFTKPEDWLYEGEYRVAYNARKQTHVQFEPTGLVEVILGDRMSTEDARQLKDIVESAPDKNLAVKQARISPRTFAVDVLE